MKVNEIFYSIEGEGIRAGMPCVFIRLHGCNLNCSYCDTRYSCEGNDYTVMSVQQILDELESYHCPNITVTGGEPLIHDGINTLLKALIRKGYNVNVETNGSIVPKVEGPIYTVDFKTKCSGMSDKMNIEAFKVLDSNDVVKFVVASVDDLEQALSFVEGNDIHANIFVSPVFGKIELVQIADFLKGHKLYNWRMQIQLHKYIWEPTKRGV